MEIVLPLALSIVDVGLDADGQGRREVQADEASTGRMEEMVANSPLPLQMWKVCTGISGSRHLTVTRARADQGDQVAPAVKAEKVAAVMGGVVDAAQTAIRVPSALLESQVGMAKTVKPR